MPHPDPLSYFGAVTYLIAAIGAALFGDAGLVLDVLAGGGLGAIIGQLVILWRSRRGSRGRAAEIVAAWTAVCAVLALLLNVVAEVL